MSVTDSSAHAIDDQVRQIPVTPTPDRGVRWWDKFTLNGVTTNCPIHMRRRYAMIGVTEVDGVERYSAYPAEPPTWCEVCEQDIPSGGVLYHQAIPWLIPPEGENGWGRDRWSATCEACAVVEFSEQSRREVEYQPPSDFVVGLWMSRGMTEAEAHARSREQFDYWVPRDGESDEDWARRILTGRSRYRCAGCDWEIAYYASGSTEHMDGRERYNVCSQACRAAARQERRHVQHEEQPCTVCGESYMPKRADSKFCSNRCRQKAHRRGKAGS